jgi:hypothetical protein
VALITVPSGHLVAPRGATAAVQDLVDVNRQLRLAGES